MGEEEPTPTAPAAISDAPEAAIADMEVETLDPAQSAAADSQTNGENGAENLKREREGAEDENGGDDASKKQKVDKSAEEERLEKAQETVEGSEEGEKEVEKKGPVSLGPKSFETSKEMFDYFFKLIHFWPANVNLNKYEHMVMLELLKMGHSEPVKKIGTGIQAFQVRMHPEWKSRCYFLIREDESVDDFSFRKCVDHILPLPEDMKVKSHVNKVLGGGGNGHGGRGGGSGHGGRGGGGGRGRGQGRGGRWRN